MKRPFLLFERGEYWYDMIAGDKTFRTTGQKSRSKAEAVTVELLISAEGRGRREEGRNLQPRRIVLVQTHLNEVITSSFEKLGDSGAVRSPSSVLPANDREPPEEPPGAFTTRSLIGEMENTLLQTGIEPVFP